MACCGTLRSLRSRGRLTGTGNYVIQIFPFALWLAVLASAVLLFALWTFGELGPRGGVVLLGWFLLAGYCQFFLASAAAAAVGLILQTSLALYLILRWKLSF